ncbi:guanitoxin biosynthesis heme-dependent pre-guanitoxin N-hydroxylase GntA [Pectobacterium brasiliense]|uniref:guanitoxin biosynthesis heme-dependent pre-guanitoxin N-hydroxylase GntA n=1 Tax=Pectobacterium brasiliense TaxID=180957 RepID=UPI000B95D458|nr:guanitoxin biosynthesis heme-dependent pre-guanitoxin N-hydroxylase GntA [Pectobacterium carotovorum]OYN52214.1 hypothetical protein B7L51_06245 [Pectobacterium carotovorum]
MSADSMEVTNSPVVLKEFIKYVGSKHFACIGAKTAAAMETLIHRDCSGESKLTLGDAYGFLRQFCSQREDISMTNSTFVLTFSDKEFADEASFESFVWITLAEMHTFDRKAGFSWSDECSSDPTSPEFGFSLVNEPFFVVGLHPLSSRESRRSPFPALVFNAHRQFRHLKQLGMFEKMQAEIRRREINIQGDLNPNLSNFGDESEARQYAGNATASDWTCPFSKKN